MNVWFAVSAGELNGQAVQMTWWFAVSLFVHETESPAVIETVAGTNPAFEMSIVTTFVVVAGADVLQVAEAFRDRANAATKVIRGNPPARPRGAQRA